jgi:hypothetical protein
MDFNAVNIEKLQSISHARNTWLKNFNLDKNDSLQNRTLLPTFQVTLARSTKISSDVHL